MLQLVNADASVVAVTNTATALTALIDTAAGADQQFPSGIAGVLLNPEDGDVRVLWDGNTPTSTKGILLKRGCFYKFPGVLVSEVKLIRTGGSNVSVGVQVGFSEGDGDLLVSPGIDVDVKMQNGTTLAAPQGPGDNFSGTTATNHNVFNLEFNGSTWDRIRGNTEVSILASAARTTTQTSADQTNHNAKGLHVTLDVTNAGTGSVTLEIQGKDAVSGKYYTVLAGAAVTTNSTNVYKIYPGLIAAANAAANDILPRTWRIVVTANNANSITYSVGATLIL